MEKAIKSNIVTEESEIKKKIVSILKGSAISIILSIILLTIFALLLTYTTLSESTIVPVVLTITGIILQVIAKKHKQLFEILLNEVNIIKELHNNNFIK